MSELHPLRPFAGVPALTIHAGITRCPEGLSLRYILSGDLSSLSIPSRRDAPARRDRLWENTCFECFFSGQDQPGYREINISPSGDWNVYAFNDYRQGMRPEKAIQEVTVTVTTTDTISVAVFLPTAGIISPGTPLKVGLCGVLREQSGQQSYWALTHPAAQPDFHDRQGFVLDL